MAKERKIIKSKKIGKSSVKLEGYKDGGAVIKLKFRTGDKLLHGDDEVHFMYFDNGLQEYGRIKKWGDMVDLVSRNN